MMEGVKTLPSQSIENSTKQPSGQSEECSEKVRNSINNNNSPSSGISKIATSTTNSSDLKYLHKKFKRIASATVDESGSGKAIGSSDSGDRVIRDDIEVDGGKKKGIIVNGVEDSKIVNNSSASTDILIQRQEVLPNKIPIVQIQPQVQANSVSFQQSAPSGQCPDPNPPSSGRNVCQYCNLNCTKPSVLQKHIRSHTNERPYPCTPCGFAFKTKSNLYKHCRSRAHTLRLQGGDAPHPDDELGFTSDQDQENDLSSNASGSDVVSNTLQYTLPLPKFRKWQKGDF